MKLLRSRWGGCVGLVALLLFVALARCWKHRIGSTDLGLNYAVVNYIAETGRWPDESAVYLRSMNNYPPFAHTVAAAVSWIIGSRWLAIHLVSTMCAAAAWAFLFLLLRFDTAKRTVLAATGLTAGAVLLAETHVLFGHEITGNFFFAQVFGAASLLALVLLRARLRLPLWVEAVASVMVMILLGWVYQVAALQLGAFAILWRAIEIGRAWYSSRRMRWSELVSLAILSIGVAAAFLLHPRYIAAVQHGTNEGWIGVDVPRSLIGPLTIALCIAAVGLAISVIRGSLRLRAGQAFAALCGAVALASLAQHVAFYIAGSGSRYLLQKHFFPVSTLLLAAVVVLAVQRWSSWWRDRPALSSSTIARFTWLPAALIAFAANNAPWRGKPVLPLVRTERFLTEALRERPELAGRTFLLTGESVTRMTFSLGVFRLPMEPTIALTLLQPTPDERVKIARDAHITHAVVGAAETINRNCIVAQDATTSLAIVDYACHIGSVAQPP